MLSTEKNQTAREVLILADDFTGALDTAVQLTGYGKKIQVIDAEKAPSDLKSLESEVLVFNTDTRHISPELAREKICRLAKLATKAGFRCIYKKTDSVLRGNIGAELDGAMEGSGRTKVCFAPAFPKLERTTRKGIQCWKGIPVHETAFGKDPFEPLKTSDVCEVLGAQGINSCQSLPSNASVSDAAASCLIFDAETEADLKAIAKTLRGQEESCILAGCAGFAEWIPELMGWEKARTEIPVCTDQLLIVSGSVHPMTAGQLRYAEEQGLSVCYLDPRKADQQEERERLVECVDSCFKNVQQACLAVPAKKIDPSESNAREMISGCLADITRRVIEKNKHTVLMVNGGDTLLDVLRTLGNHYVSPICEVFPGIVLSYADTDFGLLAVVTKSGGFGDESVLIKIREGLKQCV